MKNSFLKKLLIFTSLLFLAVVFFAMSVFAQDGAVASVGGIEYDTLQSAIDAAYSGDTVTLLKDIALESNLNDAAKGVFNINADDKITIDLNGKTVSVTDNSDGNFIAFYNYGNLALKNGTISVTSTVDRGWNAESAVVLNRGGSLVIESGTYKHNGGTSMAFALDNSGNSFGDAYATINDGTLISTYTAIRLRMADTTLNGNPGNGVAELTVKGGYIYGANRGVWGHITNSYSGELGSLDITGGTIGGGKNAINMAMDEYDNIGVTISGDARIEGTISGEANDFEISGGSFTAAIPEGFLADGFSPVLNDDGSYSVNVALTAAFSFLGYSVNAEYTSITAGYTVDQEILALWISQNNADGFDFGCIFGTNNKLAEGSMKSFAKYTEYQTFNAKIQGIDKTNDKHINTNLSMALYINRGNGTEYVVEINGKIAIVGAEDVPTVTFASFLPKNN